MTRIMYFSMTILDQKWFCIVYSGLTSNYMQSPYKILFTFLGSHAGNKKQVSDGWSSKYNRRSGGTKQKTNIFES